MQSPMMHAKFKKCHQFNQISYSVSKRDRLKVESGRKSTQNFALLTTPCKNRGWIGEMSLLSGKI